MSNKKQIVGRFDLEVLDVGGVVINFWIGQVGIGLRVGKRDETTEIEPIVGFILCKKTFDIVKNEICHTQVEFVTGTEPLNKDSSPPHREARTVKLEMEDKLVQIKKSLICYSYQTRTTIYLSVYPPNDVQYNILLYVAIGTKIKWVTSADEELELFYPGQNTYVADKSSNADKSQNAISHAS